MLGLARLLIVASLLATLSVTCAVAPARASAARASKLAQQAERKYDVGRFQEALEKYEQAYEQDPAPRYLFRIGDCYARLDQPDKALFYFERFVSKGPAGAELERAQQRIGELRALIEARDRGRDKKRLALLPVDAGEARELSDQLTGLAFDAIVRLDAFTVTDLVRTRAELADARDMGIECARSDLKCLTKLAILLRVDQLIVASASAPGDEPVLTLVLIDTTAATKLNQTEGTLPPVGPARVRAVRGLVAELVAPFSPDVDLAAGEEEDLPPENPLEPRGPRPQYEDPAYLPAKEGPSVLFLTGAGLAGTGALLGVGAGATAITLDSLLLYTDVGGSKQERLDLLTAERVLAVVAVAGAGVLVIGGALVVASWGE